MAVLAGAAVVVTGHYSSSTSVATVTPPVVATSPSAILNAAPVVPTAAAETVRTDTPPPAPTPRELVRYRVKPGENLTAIAAYFGSRNDDIIRANNLPANGRVLAGQELVIPVGP